MKNGCYGQGLKAARSAKLGNSPKKKLGKTKSNSFKKNQFKVPAVSETGNVFFKKKVKKTNKKTIKQNANQCHHPNWFNDIDRYKNRLKNDYYVTLPQHSLPTKTNEKKITGHVRVRSTLIGRYDSRSTRP